MPDTPAPRPQRPRTEADRLEAIVDAAPGAVFRLRQDADGSRRFEYLSDGGRNLLGLAPGEAESGLAHVWARVLGEDRNLVAAALEESARRLIPWDQDFRVLNPDGTLRWLRGLARPEAAGDGVAWNGLLIDVTDRKQADEALRHRSALLNELFESSPEAIVLLDPSDRVLQINPQFTATFGYTAAEAVGHPVNVLVVPPGRTEEASRFTTQLTRGRPLNVETVRRRKDGSLIEVSILGVPIHLAGELVALLGIYRDITAHKQLQNQLLQALKMESIGRLAGGVAHDFNNLLTAILGYAAIAEESLEAGDGRRAHIEQIRAAAARAADLTRQLLAFARRQVIEPRVVDLGALVAEMERMLRRLLGERVELSTETGPGLWPVRVDPGQFEQVVMNLAVNARDAMPDGGRLTIGIRNLAVAPAERPEDGKVPAGDYVLLSVRDTGAGMGPETLGHLFEPFFTTKEVGQGTGLGLATCYGIVKQNHGFIFASSAPGEGSVFRVYLPRTAEAPDPDARGGERALHPPGGTETILLVEDERVVRSVAARVLRRQGYQVLEAEGGEEALGLAAEHYGRIHLIVTDLVMPRMNGEEVAVRLVAARPGTRVLFISGYPGESVLNGGSRVPGADLLQKPFTPAALALKVREILDGGPAPHQGEGGTPPR